MGPFYEQALILEAVSHYAAMTYVELRETGQQIATDCSERFTTEHPNRYLTDE